MTTVEWSQWTERWRPPVMSVSYQPSSSPLSHPNLSSPSSSQSPLHTSVATHPPLPLPSPVMGNSQSGELQLAVMANILTARPIPPTDRAFWEKLLSVGTSPGDIFDNFTLEVLRVIRDRQPSNFASLVKLVCM